MHRNVHLYFTREKDMPELNASDELMNQIGSMSRRVIMCTSWAELPEKLKLNPRSICFNYRELEHSSAIKIVNMVRTMVRLVNLPYEPSLCVDVGKNTPRSIVKLLQKSEIQGIIPRPCDFGWEECLKGSNAIWADTPYWPEHIINQLPCGTKQNLTNRQEEIGNLIAHRGISNKQIAKTIGISESAVKMHLTKIFKKHGVTSRSQLIRTLLENQ